MSIDGRSRHSIPSDTLSTESRIILSGHSGIGPTIPLLVGLQLVLPPLLVAVFVFVPPRPVAVAVFAAMSVFVFAVLFVFPLLPRLSVHCSSVHRSPIPIHCGG